MGFDFAPTVRGTKVEVLASESGTVRYAGVNTSGGFGHTVIIDHGYLPSLTPGKSERLISLYAHMASGSITVEPGQKVVQGQRIGVMGTTGKSTGVHLHFSVLAVDKLPYSTSYGGPIGFTESSVGGTQRTLDLMELGDLEHFPQLGKRADTSRPLAEKIADDIMRENQLHSEKNYGPSQPTLLPRDQEAKPVKPDGRLGAPRKHRDVDRDRGGNRGPDRIDFGGGNNSYTGSGPHTGGDSAREPLVKGDGGRGGNSDTGGREVIEIIFDDSEGLHIGPSDSRYDPGGNDDESGEDLSD